MEETISFKTGTSHTISLGSNPTTGYNWYITLSPGLELVDEDFVIKNRAVGASGTKKFIITAYEPGTYYVVLMNMRSWEPYNMCNAKRYTVKVR
jgi:Predicted secreted protein